MRAHTPRDPSSTRRRINGTPLIQKSAGPNWTVPQQGRRC